MAQTYMILLGVGSRAETTSQLINYLIDFSVQGAIFKLLILSDSSLLSYMTKKNMKLSHFRS